MRPSYLTVFANKVVVEERPHFPSVWHSSASVPSSPTSHIQDLAAVGCFSEGAISNHVIWSSGGKLRDFNTPERCRVGLGELRDTLSHSHCCGGGLGGHICSWMSVDDFTLSTRLFCQAADAAQLQGLAAMCNSLPALEGNTSATSSVSPASLVCCACALLASYMLQPALLLSVVEEASLFSLTSQGAASGWFNCFSLSSCNSFVPLLNSRDQSLLQGAVVDALVFNRAASDALSWFHHSL